MEKPNDIKRDSISVNYFLNTAAYSGLFSLLSVILTGQVSAASSLYVGLALGILSLFSRGSTVFIGSLIERFSTVSLTEAGFFTFAATTGNGWFYRLPFCGFGFAGTRSFIG